MSLFRANGKKGLGGERDFALVILGLPHSKDRHRQGPQQPAGNAGCVPEWAVGLETADLRNESLANAQRWKRADLEKRCRLTPATDQQPSVRFRGKEPGKGPEKKRQRTVAVNQGKLKSREKAHQEGVVSDVT